MPPTCSSPTNPRYEGSSLLLFDQHHRPVEAKNLTPEERKRYTWRRCYKLVSLLHTHRAGEFFLYAGLRVTEGRAHEAPVLTSWWRPLCAITAGAC